MGPKHCWLNQPQRLSGRTLLAQGAIELDLNLQAIYTPPPPDIGHLVSGSLWVGLPTEPYVVPATLAPMLLYVLTGNLVMTGSTLATEPLPARVACPPRQLPRFSVCGGTRSVRRLHATPGTQVLLTPVRPGQCIRLLGLPAGELFEQLIDAAELLPTAPLAHLHGQMDAAWHPADATHPSTQAATSVWHGFLCGLQRQHHPLDAGLVVPPDWLDTPVPTLAQQWGLSVRQFERRFQTTHGQSLRAYRQQSRCSRLLTQASGALNQPLSWADTAADAGYADQAHLSRDVLRFTGHTPAALLAGVRAQEPALWPFHVSPQVMPRWFGPHGY